MKDAKFEWKNKKDQAFKKLLRRMNSDTYLTPYNPTKEMHLVTDASPKGLAALLYQEDRAGGSQ